MNDKQSLRRMRADSAHPGASGRLHTVLKRGYMDKRSANFIPSMEIGNLGVRHLKRYWEKRMLEGDKVNSGVWLFCMMDQAASFC